MRHGAITWGSCQKVGYCIVSACHDNGSRRTAEPRHRIRRAGLYALLTAALYALVFINMF